MKYFHRFVSHRKKMNTLTRLKNQEGDWVDDELMHAKIMSYYSSIFHTSNTNVDILRDVPAKITQETNDVLLRSIETDEVKSAFVFYGS